MGLALVLSACAGDLRDPERFEDGGGAGEGASAACGDVEQAVLATKCATSGCHDAASKSGKLDLSGAGVHARLVGQPATGGGTLVDPGNPDKSVLYEKLLPMPPYGSRMPLGSALDDATIACVRAWVASGAVDAGAPAEAAASMSTDASGE